MATVKYFQEQWYSIGTITHFHPGQVHQYQIHGTPFLNGAISVSVHAYVGDPPSQPAGERILLVENIRHRWIKPEIPILLSFGIKNVGPQIIKSYFIQIGVISR